MLHCYCEYWTGICIQSWGHPLTCWHIGEYRHKNVQNTWENENIYFTFENKQLVVLVLHLQLCKSMTNQQLVVILEF